MCKSIFYSHILAAVEKETEVSRERILSREKESDVVEARGLLFYYLFRNGFSYVQISRLTGLTRQCVAASISRFPTKDNRSNFLTIIMQQIEKDL